MNRKERRAAEKRRDGAAKKQDAVADGTASLSIADLAAEACFSLFWHALDIVWIGVFTIVYLGAR